MGAFWTRRNDDNSDDDDDDIISECGSVIACDVSLVALFFIYMQFYKLHCFVTYLALL